ncbi:MAG: toll/interleukin-1 receptor domain-containing protein [Caulobacterales bacterium]
MTFSSPNKREERARCERIANKLKALNLNVWFDARLPSGKSFDREIESTIKKAKAVLVLWSPASVESEWVRNEAGIGKERGVLAAAQLASCELPIAFRATHYETLFEEGFADDHSGWIKVLERIGELTGRPGIASYSKALGQGSAPLLAWARANHTDPLALKMEKLAERLNAADEEAGSVTVRKGAGPGALLASALVAAGIAGPFAWVAKPEPPPAAPPDLTPRQAALELVGRWNEVGLGDCEAGALVVSVEPSGLALSYGTVRDGIAVVGVADGWVTLADGAFLRRSGANLQLKQGADGAASEFTPCG